MTFAAYEGSRSHGQPTTFYLFRYGPEPDSYYAYSDGERSMEVAIPGVGTITFEPVPIARGEFSSSGALDREGLDVRLDDDLELCLLFRDYPPSDVVTLSIYEGHIDEGEVAGVWFGRVIGYGSDGPTKAKLTCEPVASSLKRPGLRRHYQYGCPHVLYGSACRADKEAATSTVEAQSVSGGVVKLLVGWNANPDYFVGGIATWIRVDGRTERRTIIAAEADQIVLAGPALGMVAPGPISLSLGCNHQMSDCRTLHKNILNFGGQPWIPTKNPVGLTNSFY